MPARQVRLVEIRRHPARPYSAIRKNFKRFTIAGQQPASMRRIINYIITSRLRRQAQGRMERRRPWAE